MKVTLVNITNNPIEILYKAFRVCYSKVPQSEIKLPTYTVEDEDGNLSQRTDLNKMVEFMKPLIKKGHESPLEHVTMTFEIEGVSRALMGQLTRHRTASFCIQSQRYVDAENFGTVIPPSIADMGFEEEFKAHTAQALNLYVKLTEAGIPREDARFVLPEATTTNITMTIDLRNFRHFYELRSCSKSQWEVRTLAIAMGRELTKHLPPAIAVLSPCEKCFDCFK